MSDNKDEKDCNEKDYNKTTAKKIKDSYQKKKFTSCRIPSAKQEQKYRDIVEYFRQGKSQEQVKELMGEKYNIKATTVTSLINQTLRWIGKSDAEQIQYYKDNARCMQQIRLEDVYSRCIQSRNYKEAINALKELNKLLGLYSDVTNNYTQINNNMGDTPTVIKFRFGTGEQLQIENNGISVIENNG